MTIVSYGYSGTVGEAEIAVASPFFGERYGVAGSPDWKVTAHATLDRTVTVAIGVGYGYFVRDVSNAAVNVQCATIATGTRWDLIVARRNWNTNTTSFVAISGAGSGTKAIPAARNVAPGDIDDQPIALVQLTAGNTHVGAITDLRMWSSKVVYCSDLLAIPNPQLGTEAVIGDVRWRYELDATSNPAWEQDKTSSARQVLTVDGSVFSSATGWSSFDYASTPLDNGVLRVGNLVDLTFEIRRVGAQLDFGASGGLTDAVIATLSDVNIRPWFGVPIPAIYVGVGGGNYPCMLYLSTAGTLSLLSGTANASLPPLTTSGSYSIKAHASYLVKS